MEIKAQITKKLQKYKADEIKTLYQLMLRVLSGNDDFRMVQNADTDDLRPVIEGETGEKIDFAMESIISGGVPEAVAGHPGRGSGKSKIKEGRQN